MAHQRRQLPIDEGLTLPEGHTLHRAAKDHTSWFGGERVTVTSRQGTFGDAVQLDGRVFEGAEAWGKHLFHHYAGGLSVHVHLGLFGKFFRHRRGDATDPFPEPRDTSRMRVAGSERAIDLIGATQCELLATDDIGAVTAKLGPDPLRSGKDADPQLAYAALQRRSVGIGRALMDQKVLAGVGNVFRAEILFVHGLHPEVPAKAISEETWLAMWEQLQTWLRWGVRTNRIVTTDPDEIGRVRSRMRRHERTYVYKQDRCRRCGTEIRRWDLSGRWAYACESCQPPPP